ncbi:MAG: hypothetical protein ABJA84_09545 [Polaromonas sp.]
MTLTTSGCPAPPVYTRSCCARSSRFPRNLKAYSPEFVRGWTVEHHRRDGR